MTDSAIIQIKDRLDIVEVIGGYISLQKSGTSYKARCPFHQEKTASFHVFPHTGTWHCFGACGTGGDVISFVQKIEHLDFGETLRMLADRAGVQLQRGDNVQVELVNRLRDINYVAAAFYHDRLLHGPEEQVARDYLERRAISRDAIDRFQLGCAPAGWDALLKYMTARGYSLDDLVTAGLVTAREGGGYDTFRNRIMIPIRDIRDRVIGFGGRNLEDKEPKYVNTAQTPLFDKSRVIFGLDMARRSLKARNQIILVEGYMDVIRAHMHGFKNVVAAMGTAITAQQLQILNGYGSTFVFALDADAAGASATLRSIHVLRETLASPTVPVPLKSGKMRYETRLNKVVKIAAMPPNQDPDDVIRASAEHWQELIDAATPLVDFYFEKTAAELELDEAHGKAELVQNLIPIISEIYDPVERRHYLGKLATMAAVTERVLDRELEAYARRASRQQPASAAPLADDEPPLWDEDVIPGTQVAASTLDRPKMVGLEQRILAYIVMDPAWLPRADDDLAELLLDPVSTDDFSEAVNKAIFDAQQEFLYSDAAEMMETIMATLDSSTHPYLQEIAQITASLSALKQDQQRKDLVDSILRLRKNRLSTERRHLEALQRHATDAEERRTLGQRLVAIVKHTRKLDLALSNRQQSSQWYQRKTVST